MAVAFRVGSLSTRLRAVSLVEVDAAGEGDPDAALVTRMAAGDRTALSQLYQRHASILFALAMRIIRDRCEVEDVLHDVFLEAWRSAADFNPKRGRVRSWLIIRMRSRALDHQKSARVARNAGNGALDVLVDHTQTPSPDHVRIRAELDALIPTQRRVLELAYFEGMTCWEIAERLAIPVGTVKSRLATGLDSLRAGMNRRGQAA